MTDDLGTDSAADDPRIEALTRASRSIHVAPLDAVQFVSTARVRRRRRRTIIGSVLATAVIVAGVSVATTGSSPNRDVGLDVADQPDAPSNRPLADLAVSVKPRSSAPGGTRGTATWNPTSRTVTYVPPNEYNGCLVEGSATSAGGSVTLILDRPKVEDGVFCTAIALTVTVTISGLSEAPNELIVSESGETTTVPVNAAPKIVLLAAMAPSDVTRQAAISGPLNLQGDCVSVGSNVAIWPYGTTVISEFPLQIRVPDAGVFTEGEVVTGPGGFFDAATDDVLVQIPDSCGTTRGTTINPQLE